MSDAENWCQEQLRNLKKEELRCVALNDIRDHLNSIPSFEASHKVKLMKLPHIFDCLDSSDAKQINSACEVLEVCFSNLSIGYVAENAKNHILKALKHNNVIVRQLAINEIHRTVCSDSKLIPLPEYMDIAVAVVQTISDEELKVSVKAMEIVTKGVWFAYPELVSELRNTLQGDSSARCKCYETIVNIAKKSPEDLESCAKEGFFQVMFAELKTADVLLQLNILELFANLAVSPHGLKYLVDNGVLRMLSELIGNLEGNPLSNILIPGLMRFFGNITHSYPMEIFENYPSVVDALFHSIKSNNASILPTALDTLGYIGSTIIGKIALGTLGYLIPSSIADIGSYIKNSPTDLRLRALHCVDNLIAIKNDERQNGNAVDQRVVLMTREWFRQLSDRPTSVEVIFGMCKNPFPDIRLAAFGVLSAICQYQWGEEIVRDTPGLLEFLLDRGAQHDKDSKHAIYGIIVQLSKSNIFDANTVVKLQSYIKQGPFYIHILDVAIEGAD